MFMALPMPLFGIALQLPSDLVSPASPKAEIMQHQHHFLPVGAHILGAAHDQGRGHQALFLHALMECIR
jgi:hypothetical protein